jgi:hypothetical protein
VASRLKTICVVCICCQVLIWRNLRAANDFSWQKLATYVEQHRAGGAATLLSIPLHTRGSYLSGQCSSQVASGSTADPPDLHDSMSAPYFIARLDAMIHHARKCVLGSSGVAQGQQAECECMTRLPRPSIVMPMLRRCQMRQLGTGSEGWRSGRAACAHQPHGGQPSPHPVLWHPAAAGRLPAAAAAAEHHRQQPRSERLHQPGAGVSHSAACVHLRSIANADARCPPPGCQPQPVSGCSGVASSLGRRGRGCHMQRVLRCSLEPKHERASCRCDTIQ